MCSPYASDFSETISIKRFSVSNLQAAYTVCRPFETLQQSHWTATATHTSRPVYRRSQPHLKGAHLCMFTVLVTRVRLSTACQINLHSSFVNTTKTLLSAKVRCVRCVCVCLPQISERETELFLSSAVVQSIAWIRCSLLGTSEWSKKFEGVRSGCKLVKWWSIWRILHWKTFIENIRGPESVPKTVMKPRQGQERNSRHSNQERVWCVNLF